MYTTHTPCASSTVIMMKFVSSESLQVGEYYTARRQRGR